MSIQEFTAGSGVVSPEERELREHPEVYLVRDISVDTGRVFKVQFKSGVLPSVFLESGTYSIRDIWVGCVPPWYLRPVADEWCLRVGWGRCAIAAEIEVEV